ncbi:MAG: hydroxymethylglutaryl-CoA reductase [Bacteroidia bacterium]|nr:hydroxymethylglutaryl-CoA reductase [Bacteroidia bacterium]
MFIPSLLLKKLYSLGSLQNEAQGVRFSIKNRLNDVVLTEISEISLDSRVVPLDKIRLEEGPGKWLKAAEISPDSPLDFPLKKSIAIHLDHPVLPDGKHRIGVQFVTRTFGKLKIEVEDGLAESHDQLISIPRSETDDYAADIIQKRREFLQKVTQTRPKHIFSPSFDPHEAQGNMENFIGVAQVPLGLAGPVQVNGEHAQGEFYIPLATSEGTLVASYNRGMKAINLSGGATVTVQDDVMQRAPVFILPDARRARDFKQWVLEHFDEIRAQAEQTTSVGKLRLIDPYLSNKFVYLRFNYFTGDAAGMNMVGRATFAACCWIMDHFPGKIEDFFLEANFATDKKASKVNMLHTRGKRVTAECTLKKEVLLQHMRVEPEKLAHLWGVSTVGAFLAGANNNGAHSPNAITALFIATGQDVANVSESSAGVLYTELTSEGDVYLSLTLPSLIVATYGGGTGLPTQRECLEIMDCYGKGKVMKFAEIVAAVCLAGEVSLGAAIVTTDWVSSHERYGRNR